jgi:hypothetical protein
VVRAETSGGTFVEDDGTDRGITDSVDEAILSHTIESGHSVEIGKFLFSVTGSRSEENISEIPPTEAAEEGSASLVSVISGVLLSQDSSGLFRSEKRALFS